MKEKQRSRWIRCAHRKPGKAARNIAYLAVLLLLCPASRVFAQNEAGQSVGDEMATAHRTRSHLFGEWDGKRSELASRGIAFDFFYVADLQANPVGGTRQAEAGWGRILGTMDIDFGKLTDWNGLTFHATRVWQFGGNLGAEIGTLANPSGLVSAHATRLDSFWLQRPSLTIAFSSGQVNLRASTSMAIRNTALLT